MFGCDNELDKQSYYVFVWFSWYRIDCKMVSCGKRVTSCFQFHVASSLLGDGCTRFKSFRVGSENPVWSRVVLGQIVCLAFAWFACV